MEDDLEALIANSRELVKRAKEACRRADEAIKESMGLYRQFTGPRYPRSDAPLQRPERSGQTHRRARD